MNIRFVKKMKIYETYETSKRGGRPGVSGVVVCSHGSMRIRVAKPSGSKVEISVREDDKVETLRAMVVMMLEVIAPVPPIRSCICARAPQWARSKSGDGLAPQRPSLCTPTNPSDTSRAKTDGRAAGRHAMRSSLDKGTLVLPREHRLVDLLLSLSSRVERGHRIRCLVLHLEATVSHSRRLPPPSSASESLARILLCRPQNRSKVWRAAAQQSWRDRQEGGGREGGG